MANEPLLNHFPFPIEFPPVNGLGWRLILLVGIGERPIRIYKTAFTGAAQKASASVVTIVPS